MSTQKPEKLTIEKLKTYKGFEHLTENELKKELSNIEKCAKVFLRLYLISIKKEK